MMPCAASPSSFSCAGFSVWLSLGFSSISRVLESDASRSDSFISCVGFSVWISLGFSLGLV